jgi:tRNA-dihydrouridine synthase B
VSEVKRLLVEHLHDHYSLYDEFIGVRSARKHIGWYVRDLPGGESFRSEMNVLQDSVSQVAAVEQFFDDLNEKMDRIPTNGDVANTRGRDMTECVV